MRNIRYGRRTPHSSTVRNHVVALAVSYNLKGDSFCRSGGDACSRMAQSYGAVATGKTQAGVKSGVGRLGGMHTTLQTDYSVTVLLTPCLPSPALP